MKTFGSRLKWARTKANLSQGNLALEANVTQGLISKLERGDQDSTGSVTKIALACGVDAHWLATGEGQAELVYDPIALSLSKTIAALTVADFTRVCALIDKLETEATYDHRRRNVGGIYNGETNQDSRPSHNIKPTPFEQGIAESLQTKKSA